MNGRLRALAVLLVLAAPVYATDPTSETVSDAAGTVGAFLARGGGARATAMGEAFTAVADDASAQSWNPAGLGRVGGASALVTYDAMGAGVGQTYLAAAVPVGGIVFGASGSLLSFGSVDARDTYGFLTGSKQNSVTESAGDIAVAGPAPALLGMPVWVGGSLEAVNASAGGLLRALSIGATMGGRGGLAVGVALSRYGEGTVEGYRLPGAVKIGAAYSTSPLWTAAADLGVPLANGKTWVSIGGEVTPVPALAIRAGYKILTESQGLTGLSGLALGFGARWGSFGVDYAFSPYGNLTTSHRIGLTYGPPAPAR